MKSFEAAINLTHFLQDTNGNINSIWTGRMSAKDQRALFGTYLGKGTIVINGKLETVCNRVSVCFGLDYDERNVTRWSSL